MFFLVNHLFLILKSTWTESPCFLYSPSYSTPGIMTRIFWLWFNVCQKKNNMKVTLSQPPRTPTPKFCSCKGNHHTFCGPPLTPMSPSKWDKISPLYLYLITCWPFQTHQIPTKISKMFISSVRSSSYVVMLTLILLTTILWSDFTKNI